MSSWLVHVIAMDESEGGFLLDKQYTVDDCADEMMARAKVLEELTQLQGLSMEAEVDMSITPLVDAVVVDDLSGDPNDLGEVDYAGGV